MQKKHWMFSGLAALAFAFAVSGSAGFVDSTSCQNGNSTNLNDFALGLEGALGQLQTPLKIAGATDGAHSHYGYCWKCRYNCGLKGLPPEWKCGMDCGMGWYSDCD